MKIHSFFHPQYLSSEKYIKVCLEIENDKGERVGMFAAIHNPRSGKSQVQRYIYDANNPRNVFNIIGRDRTGLICFYDKFVEAWPTFDPEVKRGFKDCIFQLHRSFRRFLEVYTALTVDERKQVRDFINSIDPENYNASVSTSNTVEAPAWTEIKFDDYNAYQISAITELIVKANNPADGVEFEGNKYRFVEKSGFTTLEVLKKDAENKPVVETASETVSENTRKFVQMVKVLDVNGLTEFVVGNFYPIVDRINRNGKDYFTVKINDFEVRSVSAKRVKVVNVFTENPA